MGPAPRRPHRPAAPLRRASRQRLGCVRFALPPGARGVLLTRAPRWALVLLFAALLAAFAAGIWGTILRPPAYEVRGTVLARPASNLLLVRHEAVEALGMGRMEMMAVSGEAALLDAADPKPGDRVRLAVRRKDDEIVLIRIEKLR